MSAKLCILGPGGRMGASLIKLSDGFPSLALDSAVERAGRHSVGNTVGSTLVTDDLDGALAAADVYIDFTAPEATRDAATRAKNHKTAAVIGTTGLTEADNAAIDALAKVAPVVVAANFSIGVNVLLAVAELAAKALGPGYDLEVVETHHRNKKDAPSGTAIALGQALARGRDLDFEANRRASREGIIGARPDDEIGIATLRGGSVVGEHTAFLYGEHERLELSHRAADRSIFADGALRAASWLIGKPPGRYSIRDILGL